MAKTIDVKVKCGSQILRLEIEAEDLCLLGGQGNLGNKVGVTHLLRPNGGDLISLYNAHNGRWEGAGRPQVRSWKDRGARTHQYKA